MVQTIPKERKILLCVDESENAQRAVDYVGRIVGDLPGFQVALVSIVEEPSSDIFSRPEDRDHYLSEKQNTINEVLRNARDRLIELGVDEKSVTVELHQRQCDSLAECILDEAAGHRLWHGGRGTKRVVQVGRVPVRERVQQSRSLRPRLHCLGG